MTFVSDFEPRELWQHFDKILTIPRPSKDEAKMREYVIGVAERNGLEYQVDDAGNVVVKKPGTAGRENAPPVIVQAHLDMVQEKNSDVAFDFATDAIQPQVDGEYLKATGTTLGSDCGVGVASMLALAEARELVHGPLELLFTIDEETGLTGAAELGEDLLEGKRLINVDSEEEGVLTIGCAGGADSHLHFPVSRKATPEGAKALTVKLSGLKGGHSGVDIHLQRGNAIQLLVRALYSGAHEHPHDLASLEGGNAHNAIPREAHAVVTVAADRADTVRAGIDQELRAIAAELSTVEPDLRWQIEPTDPPSEVYDDDTARRIVHLVQALPHGIITMSYDIPGLVETSTNLAVVGEKDGQFQVLMSSRSSVESALHAVRKKIRSAGHLAGAEIEEGGGYPGWKPDVESELLQVVKEVHQQELGEEPEVGAIHAGLECGIIGEKYGGMDMISFGPQIEFPHSPDERVKIDSVGRYYKLLTATLQRLSATS